MSTLKVRPKLNKIKVSIIVPTYKEAKNISLLTERISNVMTNINEPYELIFVDDNSHDGIEEIVASFVVRDIPARIIVRTEERGLSSAVLRGFSEAEGEILICMDADLSHPPETIPEMIEIIQEDSAEFIVGSRYVEGGSTDSRWSLYRYLISKFASLTAKPLTTLKDPMSGFFAIPKKVYKRGDRLNPIGFKIGLELLVKCHCKSIKEIPIHFSERLYGQTKFNLKESLKYLVHIKRLIAYKYKLKALSRIRERNQDSI